MIEPNYFWSILAVCAVIIIIPGKAHHYPSSFSDATSPKYLSRGWGNVLDKNNEYIASRMRFRIYTSLSVDDVPAQESELLYGSLDHSRPSVLYIHGFREHPSNESIRTVVGAHLERGTDNIMVLDWSDLSFENYVTVVGRVKPIAKILTRTFDDLVRLGLDLETFHVVGHSLGAQIGGFFGKYSRHSLRRITGLDPALPGFYHAGAEHIDAGSARFVDIVHTDGGVYGAWSATGTVDFFANGGSRPQPGCPLLGVPLTPSDLCNHWRSWRFYAESVINEFAFPAVQCSSFSDFSSGNCAWNRRIYFGYAAPGNAHGSFYFTTNAKSPFSNSSNFELANFL